MNKLFQIIIEKKSNRVLNTDIIIIYVLLQTFGFRSLFIKYFEPSVHLVFKCSNIIHCSSFILDEDTTNTNLNITRN
jgi:hypothetical protein